MKGRCPGELGDAARITLPGPGLGAAGELGDAARITLPGPGLGAVPIQYADYALWQRSWMEAGEKERQLAYWTGLLGGEQPVFQISVDASFYLPIMRTTPGDGEE